MLVYYLYFSRACYLFLKHIFLGVTDAFKQNTFISQAISIPFGDFLEELC